MRRRAYRRAEADLAPIEERPWRTFAKCVRPDVIHSALDAVPADHPERFWLEVQAWHHAA